MVFLPIVERELRVAARKRSTVWFRVLAALIALVIGAGFLTITAAFGGSTSRSGGALFGTLTWMALACSLAVGLFFTADSLSEEKREGTLGFLFLTDLRGYDVVGGKLLATSLRGSYALLALFPVLALTLIMGGVTGLQFWKSALALVNALFCSLAAGLFVSSFSRDSQRAMGGTLLLLLLVCAAGPIVDSIVTALGHTGFHSLLSRTSPVYVFWAASAWGRTDYWTGLLATHLIGWTWLSLACVLAPRAWQDRPRRFPSPKTSLSYSWRYGGVATRAARRRKLLEPNPVLWLVLRERWPWMVAWALVLLVLGTFVTISLTTASLVWMIWARVSWLVMVVLYLWTASQATRFFVEARRSGMMELLVVTPLAGRDIVLGQWRALVKLFALPVLLLLLVQLTGSLLAQQGTGLTVNAGAYAASWDLDLNLLRVALGGLTTLGNLVALVWFGMWMGLNSRNASLATLKTLVFVQVLPSLGITLASTLIAGLLIFGSGLRGVRAPNAVMLSFPMVLTGVSALLSLGKDAAFFFSARKRLYSYFRLVAARQPATLSQSPAVPQKASTPLPPVLPTT
jgi:hypothetical protein